MLRLELVPHNGSLELLPLVVPGGKFSDGIKKEWGLESRTGRKDYKSTQAIQSSDTRAPFLILIHYRREQKILDSVQDERNGGIKRLSCWLVDTVKPPLISNREGSFV